MTSYRYTKFGIHHMPEGENGAMALLPYAGWLKLAIMDRDVLRNGAIMGLIGAAQAAGVKMVGRRIEPDGGGFDVMKGDVNTHVERHWTGYHCGTHFGDLIRDFPQIQYWESPNEPNVPVGDKARMARYAEFLAKFGQRVADAGRVAVLGNWSVGCPDFPEWSAYAPVLDLAKAGKAILGRHSYGPLTGEHAPYYALRHRLDQAEFDKLGYPNMPLLITECGVDGIMGMPPYRKAYNSDTKRFWAEYLKPFFAELYKDKYVLGAAPFTCGTGGSMTWNDMDFCHDHLEQAMESDPLSVEPEPPVVVDPPIVPPAGSDGTFEATVTLDGQAWNVAGTIRRA